MRSWSRAPVPGPRAAFTLDAATFVISALLIFRLPRLVRQAEPGPPAAFFTEFGEGIRYLTGHPVARTIAAGLFLSVAFAALDNVGLVFMVTDTLRADEQAFGFAGTIYGAAMILAPLAVLRFRPAVNPRNLLLAGLAMSGTGLALEGLSTGRSSHGSSPNERNPAPIPQSRLKLNRAPMRRFLR